MIGGGLYVFGGDSAACAGSGDGFQIDSEGAGEPAHGGRNFGTRTSLAALSFCGFWRQRGTGAAGFDGHFAPAHQVFALSRAGFGGKLIG